MQIVRLFAASLEAIAFSMAAPVFAQKYTVSVPASSGSFGNIDGNGVAAGIFGSVYVTNTYPGEAYSTIFKIGGMGASGTVAGFTWGQT